jgi:hypothetical protein
MHIRNLANNTKRPYKGGKRLYRGENASIGEANLSIGPSRPKRINNSNLDIIKEESILLYNAIKSYENIRLINYLAFR